MRLSGWQRIGVVISVAWALGAAIYQRDADLKKAGDAMSFSYQVCTEAQSIKNNFDFSNCSKKSEKDFAIWLEGSWGNVMLTSLVPIPLAWLVVYGIIRIFRWVKAGFKPD